MAQPVWITPAGNLGVIPEGVFYQLNLEASNPDGGVVFSLIAGSLPEGIQLNANGAIVGVPVAVARLQGVPLEVSQDVTSKFTVRAASLDVPPRVRDRTFEITITGDDVPEFTTPAGSLGTFYDSDRLDIQIGYTDTDPADTVIVRLAGGELPGGITVSETGLISGYIEPAVNIDRLPGYDLTPIYTLPYDFIVSAISKNYQFTLEVTDGRNSSLRTFEFFVYDRGSLTADNTVITADNTVVTADETTERRPFIINSEPSNLGTVRGDNYYAYQFIGNDFDTPSLRYAISVNQGSGLPPNLELDPVTGWYYGYLPDQGITEIDYSFNIVTYQANFANQTINITRTEQGTNHVYTTGTGVLDPGQLIQLTNSIGGLTAGVVYEIDTIISQDINTQQVIFTITGADSLTDAVGLVQATFAIVCTNTTFGTNRITCSSTEQIGPGQPIVFTGTAFGGITAAPTKVYYVLSVVNTTQFTVTERLGSTTAVTLTTASGTMSANLIVASDPYPYTIAISGAVDAEVTWLTDADLGTIDNGDVSLLRVEAVNRGGRELTYRLRSGAFNELPQGLELLPTGEIAGRVSFNTFAVDLGATTFDQNSTTWDSRFTFTVNAYAQDTEQILFNVESVRVVDGGTGYSDISLPVIEFSTPVGASAFAAQAGNVTVVGGSITSVEVASSGAGYTAPPTITITEGFGGTGYDLVPVMRATGVRDVVSVFRTFTVRVRRAYNKPYQNLEVQAMPPANDRELIAELLSNDNIFVPDYIFRPTDPYFGKADRVVYQHAFGLSPDTQDRYVESLYLNHYWKELVLGSIETAQALDADGNVVYEVVYSRVIDDLVNNQGTSVGKIVNLAYPITDPLGQQLLQVYPNSLDDMRDQVIDVVGQISNKLPLWMTSKQADGRVLGFTPAWVMCYVKPGRARQIAYYIATQFSQQLNLVDFKVDRYILDAELSRNWNPETQRWTPTPTLTTFDRFNTAGNTFIGEVDIATDLAYSDVNNRTLGYISALGGLDGQIEMINNNTIIFVKQQNYNGPPGSNYSTTDEAWQDYLYPYDSIGYDATGTDFDEAVTVPDGDGSSENERMAIYTISVDPDTELVSLTLTTQTEENDFVQINRGNFYRSAQLRYPTSPAPGLTQISWVPLETVVTTETIFDGGSMAFEAPVDMYDPTDQFDKYLVFPKANILV
jgi:hypothetical protein